MRDELLRRYADQLDGPQVNGRGCAAPGHPFSEPIWRIWIWPCPVIVSAEGGPGREEQAQRTGPARATANDRRKGQDGAGFWPTATSDRAAYDAAQCGRRRRATFRPPSTSWTMPQVEAIKDFLKTGKPVLACFGPSILRRTIGGRQAPGRRPTRWAGKTARASWRQVRQGDSIVRSRSEGFGGCPGGRAS